MRILQFYNKPLNTGGEEFVVRMVDDVYRDSGQLHTHYFYSTDWTGPKAPPKWKQALWTIYNPNSAAKARELQQQFRADAWLFQTIYPIGSVSLYREALRQNIPVIQYVNNFRPFSISSYALQGDDVPPMRDYRSTFWREIKTAAWQKSCIKTAILGTGLMLLHTQWRGAIKAWATPTDVMRRQFINAGIPASDVYTLPYRWDAMPSPPSLPEDNYFLFLGRLSDEKGVPVLCKAWDIVREKLGGKAPRLIICGNGPLVDFVVAETKRNPLLEYRGVISGNAKTETIARCRAMLAPSVWAEPRAIVTYEAYDYAKPMLASNAGGFVETVQHGITGMLHEAGNAAQLADQIIEVNSSADLRHSLGQRGRLWLLAQPTRDQWKSIFENIVRHALAK